MRRSGFTMIELLVVITVIALLAGLLLVLIPMARKAALRTKATSQLSNIRAALSLYMDRNGIYPEAGMQQDAASNSGALLTALRSVNSEDFRDSQLLDPWGSPIRYRPAKAYPFTAGNTNPDDIDSETPPQQDSYQLWSIGPDKKDQHGQGDDIVQWKKKTQ